MLDALRSLHWEFGDSGDDGTSPISDILVHLSEHSAANIRKEANTFLGYAASFVFVQILAEKITRQSGRISRGSLREFAEVISNAASELREFYYGSMCPRVLNAIPEDSDCQTAEYVKMRQSLGPIICAFEGTDGTDTFREILEDLGRGLVETTETTARSPYVDTRTLPLPFEEDGK